MRGNEYHEYIFLKITSIKPRNDQNTTGVYPGHVLKHCVALAIKQGNTGSAPINFTCQSAMSSFFLIMITEITKNNYKVCQFNCYSPK